MDDDVTLTLLSQRPTMFLDSESEMQDRVGALEMAVDDAVDSGVPPECAKILRDFVLPTNHNLSRRALIGDPPARVCPMKMQLQPSARDVRPKPLVSSAAKFAWLHEYMANLETARMVSRNRGVIYRSVAMVIPKAFNSYRMVTDYRAVNDTIEPAAMPMLNRQDKASLFADPTARCTVGMLKGYWQVPLTEDAQMLFTMVTPERLLTCAKFCRGSSTIPDISRRRWVISWMGTSIISDWCGWTIW